MCTLMQHVFINGFSIVSLGNLVYPESGTLQEATWHLIQCKAYHWETDTTNPAVCAHDFFVQHL